MSRLSKIPTLELERELLFRSIERHSENIARVRSELAAMEKKQLARMDEGARLTDQIDAANAARAIATFARKVPGANPIVKSTPRPLRRRSVKKAGVA